MKKTHHLSLLLILYIFSCICNASSIPDKNFIQIEFQDKKVMKKTLKEFKLQNIPYKIKDIRIILIKKNEIKKIIPPEKYGLLANIRQLNHIEFENGDFVTL